MEKIDKTIDLICEQIQIRIQEANMEELGRIAEMTNALATLLHARANFQIKERMCEGKKANLSCRKL